MTTTPGLLVKLVVALSLAGGLCGAPQAPDPHIRFEFEPRPALITPKFRIRDGEATLQGTSTFSRELDLEDWEFSPGGSARVLIDDDRFTFSYWHLRAEGTDQLPVAKNFSGLMLPAGTVADSHVTWDFWALDWRRRFELGENLWFDGGVALQYMVFDADLGFGSTRLSGVYPSLQTAFLTRPYEWLQLEAYAGGFYIPFRNGDTSIRKPMQLGVEARFLGEGWSLGVGYDLFHLHLEENSGDIDEDIVHNRLRGVHVALRVEF
jgi:hypothetical protein